MDKFSTVVVSNRLPVSVTKVDGKLHYEASSGGLATAMASLDVPDKIWVGWPGIDSESLTDEDKLQVTSELEARGCYPVFLTKAQTQNYYEGYANDTIWPLFHYFQALSRNNENYWAAYREVNQLFADAIGEIATEAATVWVQDYHFMILPRLVRERVPGAAIGFFLHIPFPSFEIYRLLPERKDILQGLLGADVVSFHIYDYGRHFIDSCRRLLGASVSGDVIEYDGRAVKVSSHPIGIDYEKFRAQLGTKETRAAVKELNQTYKGQKLILSVDRLDYSKGIADRLRAFQLLLEEHPEYISKVKLLMIAVPSRTEVDAYRDLRDEIEKIVSRINGTFGTVNWAPISYQFQNRPFAEVVALYARADVALVTPIRDGMNLVAKEYIASKKQPSGVLVLSEMAGAIDELPEALSVNPGSARSIAAALVTALAMPKDAQAKRIEAMQKRLRVSTVQNWGREFIAELTATAGNKTMRYKKLMSAREQRLIVTRFTAAKKRLVILDYDGTLKNFVRLPSMWAGAPSLRARRILKNLSEVPETTVAIVSGRPRRALMQWFGHYDVQLAAEHGGWTRISGRWHKVENDFRKDRRRVLELMKAYTERTTGSSIEEKEYGLVWHYINVEPDLAYKRAHELKHDLVKEFDDKLSVELGQNILEVKLADINKGKVVKALFEHYPADFVLCAGDDYTDEDMFAALADTGATTIKIGSGKTRARFQIADVADTLDFLSELAPGGLLSLGELKSKLKPTGLIKRVRHLLTGNRKEK